MEIVGKVECEFWPAQEVDLVILSIITNLDPIRPRAARRLELVIF